MTLITSADYSSVCSTRVCTMKGVLSVDMRSRSILASLVAVLLLSISCVANACETSCDLKAVGSGCHHASGTKAKMPGCGMNMSPNSAQIHANHQCRQSVCEQQPQKVVTDQTVLHAQALVTLHAFITILFFPGSMLDVRIEPANASMSRVAFLIALQTTLRV
jgi:hypothetical protein